MPSVSPAPWPHQSEELQNDQPKRAIFWSPRLGKSRYGAEWLCQFIPDRMVVVAPLNVCPQWMDVLRAVLPIMPLKAGYGLSSASLRTWLRSKPEGILVLSDSLISACVEELMAWKPTALIVDESHRFIGITTKRARAMRRLAWRTPNVRLLSGTPTPNHEGDLWGQMVALDKDKWGGSYERFAKKYLIRDSYYPSRVYGVSRPAELQALMMENASVVRREDVFGPDTWQEVLREVDLPPKSRTLYDTLAKKWILKEPMLTAEDAAVRLMRLSQLTSGILPTDDGEELVLPAPKIDACIADLDEIVEEGSKCIVYYHFRAEGLRMMEAAQKAYPFAEVLQLGGGTSIEDREYVYYTVEHADHPVIAVVQLQAGGIGRSFAEAKYECFLYEGASFADCQQAKDRIYKKGERRVVMRYRCRKTVDTGVFGHIQDTKETIHDRVRTADRSEWVGY